MVYVELEAQRAVGDVDLVAGPSARGGDLAAALAPDGAGDRRATRPAVAIDGVAVASDEPIGARLRRGSRVVVRPADQRDERPAVIELICEGGWSAGARTPLAPGRWYLAAVAEAEWHGAPPPAGGYVCCAIADDGTGSIAAVRDRTLWIAGHATFGPATISPGDGFQFAGSTWRVARPEPPAFGGPRSLPDARGGVPFNRPPRARVERPARALAAPAPAVPYTSHARVSWAMLAVPLLMGAAFAWLFGPLMALFALLTPVLVTANWLEDRVHARRHRRREAARHAADVLAFAADARAEADADAAAQRAARPPLAVLLDRARRADTRIWERRPGHDDFMRVAIGTTDARWWPALAGPALGQAPAPLDPHLLLRDVPAVVELAAGRIVGIVGDRARRAAVARALVVRVAVLHGPADVRIACVAGQDRVAAWDWLKWLPHTQLDAQSGRRLLGFARGDVDAVLTALVDGAHHGARDAAGRPLVLIVVDAPRPTPAQSQLLRDLYAGGGPPLAAVVLADAVEALPASCTAVVDVRSRADETPSLTRLAHAALREAAGHNVSSVRVEGTSPGTARRCARSLARFDDPELREAGAALPPAVALLAIAGMAQPTAESVLERWRRPPPDEDTLPVLLGARESGTLEIDLVRDGPHALLAGTTGAGKSELLRTLVASLALARDPDRVNFVLIDYKGGSAFDACARLPHVVGAVTDLDEHLGRRALICLEAELRYRELRLRTSGVSDLAGYRAAREPDGPLPRLVVVVDEFAALARELPDFMRSLVDIAQRGRSLGVHLVLATQRPAGVVNDQIRANTNLRIALRVQSAPDSTDVLDAPDAARLGRGQPGRGFARLGPGDLVAVQCAYVSGVSAEHDADASITIAPFVAAWAQPAPAPAASPPGTAGASDLERLADAITAAAGRSGRAPQRAPWPPPLPTSLTLDALAARHADAPGSADQDAGPAIGLADEPHRQRQVGWRWRRAAGNVWCCGASGSGATDALVTLAVGAAAERPVDELHIYAIDCGARGLAGLTALPHTGAVVFGGERERLIRLTAVLDEEIERRRSTTGPAPALLLVIDRYDELPAALDSPSDARVLDRLAQVVRSGQELGIHVALSTQRPGGVPASVAAALTQRLVFGLPDRQDYAAFGLRPNDVPTLPRLRAVDAATGNVVQFAHVDAIPAAAPAGAGPRRGLWSRRAQGPHAGGDARRPRPVELLPTDVPVAAVLASARIGDDGWWLPIGIGNRRLAPAGFHLREGDHALVVGPARSGKTTVLEALAEAARAADPSLAITAIAPRRSRLTDCRSVTSRMITVDPDAVAAAMRATGNPHLVLIDDADRVEDTPGTLERTLREEHPGLHAVAAARSDALRGAYAHWTRRLRLSRQALVLRPDPDVDGELFAVALPRDRAATGVGRGYLLADGDIELVQCAHVGGRTP